MTLLKSNLNQALERFKEDFEVIRESGNMDLKAKTSNLSRSTNPWVTQFMKEVIISTEVIINPGEIVRDKTNDVYYFVYTLQKQMLKTQLIIQKALFLRINNLCQIQRLSPQAGSFGGVKQQFITLGSDIRCHLREITADLRTEKPALLETAKYLLYLHNSVDLQVLDRVVINNQNYQAEHLDKLTLEGLFEAQVSLDKR